MNVILIVFDSLRKDCINCLGSPPWGRVYTPNLDKFAKEAVIFDRCYPEAVPTLQARRALYTGKRVYPFFNANFVLKGDFVGAPGWGPIPEELDTISEILQQHDYYTCLISSVPHMYKPSKNYHRGFDEWVWIRGTEIDNFRSGPTPSDDEVYSWLPEEIRYINENYFEYMKRLLMNMHDIEREEDYSVARAMRESVRWLEQNYEKDKKFLIIESFPPHEPWFAPKNYREIYDNSNNQELAISLYSDVSGVNPSLIKRAQANYSAVVTMCDRWFGYLYNSISNLNMLDDTIIIVTSDHGHSIGDDNWMGKRGYPSTPEIFDIPLLLRHPDDNIGRGITNDMLVQHIDITATILDMVGIDTKNKDPRSRLHFLHDEEILKKWVKISDMDGKSFYKNLINRDNTLRDHATMAWGTAVTVITDKWWFNCKVNGKGALLYNLEKEDPFDENVASNNIEVVKELFKIAVQDAGGKFPGYLIKMADDASQPDKPGCTDLAAD